MNGTKQAQAAHDAVTSGQLPCCPLCGDVSPRGAVVCVGCGKPLLMGLPRVFVCHEPEFECAKCGTTLDGEFACPFCGAAGQVREAVL